MTHRTLSQILAELNIALLNRIVDKWNSLPVVVVVGNDRIAVVVVENK